MMGIKQYYEIKEDIEIPVKCEPSQETSKKAKITGKF
jgi:hypothetical protein